MKVDRWNTKSGIHDAAIGFDVLAFRPDNISAFIRVSMIFIKFLDGHSYPTIVLSRLKIL